MGKHKPCEDQITIEQGLVAGEYYLFVEVDIPRNAHFNEFVMNTYSENEITLEQCNYPNFLEKALSSCAMQKTNLRKYYHDHNEPEVFRCFTMEETHCEYGYIFWYNGSDEGVLEEKVSFTQMNNVHPMAPYDLDNF